MPKPAKVMKPTSTPAASPKTLKELFDERDRTRPGSRQEGAAEKILESIFPDTNAD
jgi:hypothetical protein